MYITCENGNNDISQKIRKYLSSPKEASRTAEAAVLGASAMFKGFKMGILGCCKKCAPENPTIYGEEYRLTFHSTKGMGTYVLLKIGKNLLKGSISLPDTAGK